MLPAMIIMWGLVATLEGESVNLNRTFTHIPKGVVYNYSGLVACRFFLGLMGGLVCAHS